MQSRGKGARFAVGMVTAGLLFTGGAVAAPAIAATDPPPTVVSETLGAGNELFVYVPGGSTTGYRAASTPILLTLADGKVDAETVKETAESSGLAEIAAREQGVVAFLNPKSATWATEDRAAITQVLDRFGDSTGSPYSDAGRLCALDFPTQQTVCKYPGSKTRIYLFADGAGADFVGQHVVPGLTITPPFSPPGTTQTWTPTAVFASNARAPIVAPDVDIDIPAYVVNAQPDVADGYRALNTTSGMFLSATSATTDGFDRQALLTGYDEVLEHAIHRTTETNDSMQLYTIPDFDAEGIAVTHKSVDAGGAPLEYFQYLPASADQDNLPLVLAFHGGGNHAEYLMWSAGWPQLAKEHGFMVVSVNRHVERSADDVIDLLDSLLAEHPGIDTSRIYATGFSMGSVKTWNLSEQHPTRFAAFAPMSGSFGAAAGATGVVTPTMYFAGLASPLPERPHQNGSPNDIDGRLASLFSGNGVTDEYAFDADADAVWGIAPDAAFTVDDDQFAGVSVAVGSYASTDGRIYTALAAVHNGSHETLGVESALAWQFMSQFVRNADGSVGFADDVDAEPEVTITTSPTAATGENGWHNVPVSVTVTATDDNDDAPVIEVAIDAGDFTPYRGELTIDTDGEHTVRARATDSAGHVSATESVRIALDSTAPEAKAAFDAAAQTLTLTAIDATSGVAKIEYVLGAADDTTTWDTYTAPIALAGVRTLVSYRAIDVAGNVSSPRQHAAPIRAAISVTPGSAKPGQTVTVTGSNVPAGGYTLVLRSDPVTVASVNAGPDGELRGSFTVPATTSAGAHSVQLVNADGAVVAQASLTVTAVTGTDDDDATGSDDDGLAATGGILSTAGVVVAALLGGGGTILLYLQRRRRGARTV